MAGAEQTFTDDHITLGSGENDDVIVHGEDVRPGHVIVSRTDDGWVAERKGPARTLFVERRSKATVPITGATVLRLGSLEGPEVVLQPIDADAGALPALPPYVEALQRDHERLTRQLHFNTIALVALVVIALVVGLNAGRVTDFLRQRQLSDVERATVRLVQRDQQGAIFSWGSGTIIDSSGLVLTNAHVAGTSARGLELRYGMDYPEPDPPYLEVWMTGDGRDFAKPAYRGHVVAADGWLDLAVVRIDENLDGKKLADLPKFPTVEVGRRGGMERGDAVSAVGYPGISGGDAQRISSGTVSAWRDEERVRGERDVIDTTANITSGNSGGALVDGQGRLVAVPMASRTDATAPVSAGLARPVEFAEPLLEAARDETAYASPHVVAATGKETAKLVGWSRLRADDSCGPPSQTVPSSSGDLMCVQFDLARMRRDLDIFFGWTSPGATGFDWQTVQRATGKSSRHTFVVSAPDPDEASMTWRLDIAGGAKTLLEGQEDIAAY